MTSLIAVLKNNMRRMLQYKSRIVLIFILIIGAVIAAVFFNNRAETAGNIAVIHSGNPGGFESRYLNVTHLTKVPPLSDLVSEKYDAVVVVDGDGGYDIRTIKSDDFKAMITALINDPAGYQPDLSGNRKAGTNIIGFLTMFILMQGITMMLLFAEDKSRGQIRRIATSPVSFTGYLCAHTLFSFLFLFTPTIGLLYLIKFITGVNIGLSFPAYLLLISLLCALSSAFALIINALAKKNDTANMLGSATIVLTSVLSGSFYSFNEGNPVMDKVIQALPQKSILALADGLESGAPLNALLPHLLYLSALILVFFLVAFVKTRRDNVRH